MIAPAHPLNGDPDSGLCRQNGNGLLRLLSRDGFGAVDRPEAAALGRDRAADERDRAAEARDELMRGDDATNATLAATHRDMAAHDRLAAAEDRRQAARERAGSLADREALMRELDVAATDPLTGARMRASGIAELELEIARSRRTATSMIVAYVDVIGLKSRNDAHGHAAGDELLKRVVSTIRAHVRAYDLVVRLGGDEFLCAMSGATLVEAHARFNEMAVTLATGDPAAMTAGFAELQPEDTVDELIARADASLMALRRDAPSGRGFR